MVYRMNSNERFRRLMIWFAILGITASAVVLQQIRPDQADAETASEATDVDVEGNVADSTRVEAASGATEAADDPLDASFHVSLQGELAAKLTIALQQLVPQTPPDQLLAQSEALRQGGFADRMGYAILVGHLRGWNEGIADAMEAPLPESAVDEARALRGRVVDAMELRRALADGGDAEGKGALDAVADLRPELGFFADVVGPDAAAQAMPMLGVMLTAGCWYLLAFLGGLTSLVVLAVLLLTRKMIPVFAPAPTAHAALVLGETFVLWIALFLMLQVLMGVLGAALGDALGSSGQLLLSLVAMFGSLAALVYPRMRGVSWSALRELIGLHAGRGIVRETLAGLHCYVTAVPLLAIGLVIFAILSAIVSAIQGPSEAPSHPVVDLLGSAGPLEVLLLFTLASVAAPIVEEIAFRGLLYGHLRGTVAPHIRVVSALVAAIASSVVFAIIHPQGVLFVPALGGLAVGFCIFRELRGSLVAPMVAHGVSNAVTLTLGLSLMR